MNNFIISFSRLYIEQRNYLSSSRIISNHTPISKKADPDQAKTAYPDQAAPTQELPDLVMLCLQKR